jgi:ABC-type lipoprotein release transport system permease subunit
MEILRLAWRNLWRNPRRTALTASALGLGVLCMVATADYVEGIFGRMIETTANGRTGHAQLHAPGWRATREEELLLPAPAPLLAAARALPGVAAAAPRLWGTALLAIGDRSRSVQLLGVDPAAEAAAGGWTRQLRAGRFLEPGALGPTEGEIVLGAPLAKRLQLAPGDRVVLTAAELGSGEARSELLRVVGLLRSGDGLLDEGCAVVLRGVAQRLLGAPGGAHEIALRLRGVALDDRAAVSAVIAPLGAPARAGVEAVPWHEVAPMAAEMLRMQDTWTLIFTLMIFFVIAFVIVGTMSMALLERAWEFGLLRALGTSPGRLAALVLAEAAWLGLVGGLPGALAGHALSHLLAVVGIDFGEDVNMIVTFTEPIRPVPDLPGALGYAALFVLLTVLVSLLAAWRAARVAPAQALRSR